MLFDFTGERISMKKTNQVIVGVGAIAAIASLALLIYAVRRHNSNVRHAKVADEGYETAHDVLFPKKSRRGKLQYGPVIPR